MAGQFLNLFLLSLVIAIFVGIGSALFFKKLKPLKLSRVQECSIVIFFALMTYSFTELIGLSPIVALLFTGIFMAQYCFYNLSYQAREESSVVTKMLSTIAEGFVFVYMGLTVFYYFTKAFSLSFVIWEFFILLGSRVFMIFGSCYFLE
jgi:NhaP-type Na+/H+ or K+/H+ antiporter